MVKKEKKNNWSQDNVRWSYFFIGKSQRFKENQYYIWLGRSAYYVKHGNDTEIVIFLLQTGVQIMQVILQDDRCRTYVGI